MECTMNVSAFFVLVWLLAIFTGAARTSNEFFTAASDIELLYKLEHRLSMKFLTYVSAEEQRLSELEAFIKSIEAMHVSSIDDERKVSHPTDAFNLLKRFPREWTGTVRFSKTNTSRNDMLGLFSDLTKFKDVLPGEADLQGAIEAIFRLQDTYAIPAAKFADGMGNKGQSLILEEVFEIGFLAVGLQDFYHAEMWLLEALKRFPEGAKQVSFLSKASLLVAGSPAFDRRLAFSFHRQGTNNNLPQPNLFHPASPRNISNYCSFSTHSERRTSPSKEYLAWSEYQTGKLEDAIMHTRQVLQLDSTSSAAATNLEIFESDLDVSKTDPTVRKKFQRKQEKWLARHNAMCRDDESISQAMFNRLSCSYVHSPARFILKPLKMEILFDRPDLFLYHDLLRDHEINRIIHVARPLLNRATVHDPATGKLVYADYRVSKSAWLYEEMDETVAAVIAKVGDVTGLNMRYAEALQVANYGLGGQYEPHFDHSTKHKVKVFKNYGGNRIATMLMYLSNVEAGGKTVFTSSAGPGGATTPVKGDAVFWYNLKRNGKSDERTKHAGCPVLLGQKWVSNLWIHEHGQEFRRPCTLNKDE